MKTCVECRKQYRNIYTNERLLCSRNIKLIGSCVQKCPIDRFLRTGMSNDRFLCTEYFNCSMVHNSTHEIYKIAQKMCKDIISTYTTADISS